MAGGKGCVCVCVCPLWGTSRNRKSLFVWPRWLVWPRRLVLLRHCVVEERENRWGAQEGGTTSVQRWLVIAGHAEIRSHHTCIIEFRDTSSTCQQDKWKIAACTRCSKEVVLAWQQLCGGLTSRYCNTRHTAFLLYSRLLTSGQSLCRRCPKPFLRNINPGTS